MTGYEVAGGSPLVYGQVAIREKGEMLSLTDMWKAAGAPENREPKFWVRQESVQSFIEVLAAAENVTVDHLLRIRQGRNGGTFAHWQIGLAYAKYLSPEFHMWCNSVVRERMHGHDSQHLPAEVLEQIERTNGIVRALMARMTKIHETLPQIMAAMSQAAVAQQMAEHNLAYRRGRTAKDIWDAAGLPPKLRGSTVWLGNRLSEMGCGLMKADVGAKAVRIFDPDKAEICLKNGLRHRARVYASERMGQGKFKLVGATE
ncbi:KilA-N domain-containing protein [Salipiger manganoxidans]|nr:KilA-N domain-containing protein [Salipiger manganoxidans]MEB3419892.1 KilA-N domain-containing protein [Salipiger manganoxidans]